MLACWYFFVICVARVYLYGRWHFVFFGQLEIRIINCVLKEK